MAARTRFTGTWHIEQEIEPGSVPDRPVQYSSVTPAPLYQPERLLLVFGTSAGHADPYALRLENGSGFMRAARDGIKVRSVTICGSRLKKNGTPGRVATDERLSGNLDKAPDWVRAAVRGALTALGAGS